jgi:hypothetical protein
MLTKNAVADLEEGLTTEVALPELVTSLKICSKKDSSTSSTAGQKKQG